MIRTVWLALVAAAALSGCTQATPEQQIINDAAQALGGRDRIQAVKTLTIEGTGMNGNLGQDMTPDTTSERFDLTGYKRVVDVAAGRARIEQTRTPNFTYFQGPQPQKQVLGIDGGVGYNVAPDGTATRVPDAAASDRRADFYHHPLTIVRAALDPAAKLANPRTEGGESLIDVTTAAGLNFQLAIDAATKRPVRVTSKAANTNLGDVVMSTTFSDYKDVGGLQLPARLTTKTDDLTTVDITASSQAIDAEVGDLAVPAAAAAPLPAPPPPNVVVTEVSKGIWWLAGGSHHSVVVEFADHLTLIEAPLNDNRTLAVIAKARELRPEKPLTQMVMSHHHFDHSGGFRAAISEGLTVITDQQNVAFFQAVAKRPATIAPDALAKNPKPATVEGVDGQMTLSDKTMTMNLYRVVGNQHSDSMLMAYFPKERILVEVDVFSPGSATAPYAASLLENVKKLNLRVDRIVPLHSTIAPFSDLVKTVGAN